MAFNWAAADRCQQAAELRRIYMARVGAGGGAVKLVRTKSMDNEREAQWYNSDISILRAEMLSAEDDCREINGLPRLQRRFAITAGSRRTGRGFIRGT